MVQMCDPQEGDIICDPASGSGGFLIRTFEIVREKITHALDEDYKEYAQTLGADSSLTEEQRADLLNKKDAERNRELDGREHGSRLWKLSNRCLYGTDANERMARTSKMNMIMHGDGHGGVHHHNGFLNVNGIFEGRFDIILTNPPFGSSVEESDVVREEDTTVSREMRQRYEQEYGNLYVEAQKRLSAAKNEPIAKMFDLGGEGKGKIKTEILFIERCLSLLNPGGRLGIVLPEGIFNNPSLAYVREYCENRAFIRAVVSLPQETFYSSGASVKASLLFLQKFNQAEKTEFDSVATAALSEITTLYQPEIDATEKRITADMDAANKSKNNVRLAELRAERRDFQRKMKETIAKESRALLKSRFRYPIFLYEAEKVGITATGEPDQNELTPNDRLPAAVTETALELYRRFRTNPAAFFTPPPHH